MTGLVLVPTRGRPKAAFELLSSFTETGGYSHAELLFLVDDDDPTLEEYQWQPGLELRVGPRQRIGPTLNNVACAYANWFDWIGFMGDDHRPRTLAWATMIDDTLSFRPGVAYGNDLVHGPALATAAFVSSQYVKALGYLVPPGLLHMYLDNFWMELGRATHLAYLPELVFEHLHPIAGKAEWTEQYAEVNALMEPDRVTFERYMRDDWPLAKQRLTPAY